MRNELHMRLGWCWCCFVGTKEPRAANFIIIINIRSSALRSQFLPHVCDRDGVFSQWSGARNNETSPTRVWNDVDD